MTKDDNETQKGRPVEPGVSTITCVTCHLLSCEKMPSRRKCGDSALKLICQLSGAMHFAFLWIIEEVY